MSTRTASPSGLPYAAELAVAIEAARAAAAIQVEHYERLEHIVKKSAKDVVTEADHLSEEAIIATIRRTFPDESPGRGVRPLGVDRRRQVWPRLRFDRARGR